jgi:hypothetical protein
MPRDQEVVQPVSLSALAGSCAEARRAPERRAHAEADAGGGHTGMRLDIIVSANLAQGNLSKGQHALALVYPEPEKGAGKNSVLSKVSGLARLGQARAILRSLQVACSGSDERKKSAERYGSRWGVS